MNMAKPYVVTDKTNKLYLMLEKGKDEELCKVKQGMVERGNEKSVFDYKFPTAVWIL